MKLRMLFSQTVNITTLINPSGPKGLKPGVEDVVFTICCEQAPIVPVKYLMFARTLLFRKL